MFRKKPPLFTFNHGNFNISRKQFEIIRKAYHDKGKTSNINSEYELNFIKNIGNGYGFSLASGRMALFLLLSELKIGKGDEVIIVGFTCSVMINAIMRIGATPIFSDVSSFSLGSDPASIQALITNNTKMIIAQHSFGIPCAILDIVRIGTEKSIFVLEDCALAYGSSIDGIKVGNFGDAAIFSTDHSKPINTLIGGFFYTRKRDLFLNMKEEIINIPELSKEHKKNLWHQFVFERKYFSPNLVRFNKIKNIFDKVQKKIIGKKLLFMDGDNGPPALEKPSYPYPAKLPLFLQLLGYYELSFFEKEKENRKTILFKYLNIFNNTKYKKNIPEVYYDDSREIVPLRFVLFGDDVQELKQKLNHFIDFTQTWFKKPIIATSYSLEMFNYNYGSCKTSEYLNENIINLPCIIPKVYEEQYFILLKKALKQNKA